jgi:hypothetical protein
MADGGWRMVVGLLSLISIGERSCYQRTAPRDRAPFLCEKHTLDGWKSVRSCRCESLEEIIVIIIIIIIIIGGGGSSSSSGSSSTNSVAWLWTGQLVI